MIETTLSRSAADKLFEDNAIYFCGGDYVPDYRVYELFGESAARTFSNRGKNNLFKPGVWNLVTSTTRGKIYLFTRTGFFVFVSTHNYSLVDEERSKSQAAAAADKMAAERWAEIEREDAAALAAEKRG